ncbi:hypothetical protein H6F67_09690 [Microcoleus sp. FACHB-1515]|uniref:hypothetical protein n=1 Tax=Cyanophyceae TaxID=3028117 RepID=UPI001682AA1A|nr:hypothetical protein [Microcoleus sp. FACHB-1515]MBD2090124.1 hypothetical protein [Microcoleus sp. FACHB-1515]
MATLRPLNWFALPTAIALALGLSGTAIANPIQTPLSTNVVVNGSASGGQSGDCGYVSSTPTQVVRVTEDFTSLRFSVQGSGQPTLMVTGSNGRTQCVMADRFSQGAVEIPGVWERGTYSIFVGDRSQGNHPFTLSISQGN